MRKKMRGRVLARVVAQDLRNVSIAGAGLTPTVTEPDELRPRRDITNGLSDGDSPTY